MQEKRSSIGLRLSGLYDRLLNLVSEEFEPNNKFGIHFIIRKHGETMESAEKRYREEGHIMGDDNIIFIEDFGDPEWKAAHGPGTAKQEIPPEPKSVSKDATCEFPESGAFDRDQDIDLSDIPDAEPDPRSELHKRHIIAHMQDAQAPEPKPTRRKLDDVDEDYTADELRKMGRKVIPFRGRKGKWAWMG